jgi:D-glycero-D-manno-heptose 1,7-bisphosphate phosphatase
MRPAVFLDRDDTLIACNELPPPPPPGALGDLVDPALVRLLPGVAEGVALLKAAGFMLVVVSNQGSVARGAATIEIVQAVNSRLQEVLMAACGSAGPLLDAMYFCPFHPKGTVAAYSREHPWRKPSPGMILAAAKDLELDLTRSWLIGDAPRDIEAGVAAGIDPGRALLVGVPPMASFLDAARRVVGAP